MMLYDVKSPPPVIATSAARAWFLKCRKTINSRRNQGFSAPRKATHESILQQTIDMYFSVKKINYDFTALLES